ncbi:unnamed protein product [Paramecium sonneborni]|uniref:Uncharacterized protein n=1 Tax=Paramecium sonneborni TaxID=65129 RepID=A0A8S1QV65_9CILI|nr:unnamed protein product [Paramecium sonneborni]
MDYEYSSDIECSQVLIKNKCTTDGKQCVNRNQCQDVIDKAGCTYSINFQDCIWLQNENRCVDKNCNSALTSFISHQQCQNYLQQCTNRIGGGCVNITTCNSISFEDACFYDQFNQDCLWDNMNKKCINLECSTFCGDGIVGDLEQCDDGNLLPYDGCYKCKFQCYYGCNNCIELRCQECDQGFQLNFDGSCTEICGDGFIVGLEECDDMNNIQNDGCYLCKFQCHQQCLDCIFGFCNQCAFGWEQYNNQCQSICGNGLLVEQFEQCDDGNNQDDDGCNSKCQIEKNWICFQSQINQITECKKDLKPKIILQNISQKKDSTQIIQLQFNQQLQLKNNTRFEDFIKINVTGNVEFHLIIEPIFAAQLYLTNIKKLILLMSPFNLLNLFLLMNKTKNSFNQLILQVQVLPLLYLYNSNQDQIILLLLIKL